jgi:hypothetical protein
MFSSIDRSAKFSILVAFLVISTASLRYIPFMKPLGLDLMNIVVYQKCATHSSPYLIDASVCGDALGRGMYYPPFLFHSFRWLRGFTLEQAMHVWTPLLVVAMVGILFVWVRFIARTPRGDRAWEVPIFCGLILFQYPFVFEVERGQTDIVALLLFTGGCFFFVRRKPLIAGALLGLATAYKLYPLFACAIIALGLLLARLKKGSRPNTDWLRFGLGAFGAFAAINLAFYSDSKIYFFKVLPRVSAMYTPASTWVHAHSFTSLVGPDYTPFSWAFCAGMIGLWGWATSQAILSDEMPLALAGALAPSTYFSAFTFDYNLVTIYPLLLLLFLRARRIDRWGLLAFGSVVVFGDRQTFANPEAAIFNPTVHIALQLAFLTVAAIAVAQPTEPVTSTS